jgi:hypothetical protein
LQQGYSPVPGVIPAVYKIHNFGINSELEQTRGFISSIQKKKKKKKEEEKQSF